MVPTASIEELVRALKGASAEGLVSVLDEVPEETAGQALRRIYNDALASAQPGAFEAALGAFRAAERIARVVGDPLVANESLLMQGQMLLQLARKPEAHATLRRTFEEADRQCAKGVTGAITGLTISAYMLAVSGAAPSEAWAALSRTLTRCAELRAKHATAWVASQALEIALRSGELEAALDLGARACDAPSGPRTQDERRLPEIDLERLGAVLAQLAQAFYYDREDWPRCESAASLALRCAPTHAGALKLLGLALLRQQKIGESRAVWSRGVERGLADPAFANNLAVCALQERRFAEAEAALDRILARPEVDLRQFLNRASARYEQRKFAEAIEDLNELIARAEAGAAKEGPRTVRSAIEYEREMPSQDLADFARLMRIKCLRACARDLEADGDIEHLIRHGDQHASAAGYRLRAERALARDEFSSALADLSEALARAPSDDESRLARVDALSSLGERERALDDLAVLAHRERRAADALARLDGLVGADPSDARAWKLRGIAKFESSPPDLDGAVADFSAVLERQQADADALYRRALAQLHAREPSDDPAAATPFPLRVRTALQDLVRAFELAPANDDVRYALRWLVDRALVHESFFVLSAFDPDLGRQLRDLLPDVDVALGHMRKAGDFNIQRRWVEARQAWSDARAQCQAANLPVLAVWSLLRIADHTLRTYELEQARDELGAFLAELVAAVSQPLQRELAAKVDQPDAGELNVGGELVIELEFQGVVELAVGPMMRAQALLEAELFGRLGDAQRALAAIERLEPEIQATLRGESHGLQENALVNLAQILRDNGAPERALTMLETLAAATPDGPDDPRIFNTLGTIHHAAGRTEPARLAFERARAAIADTDRDLAAHVDLSLANVLLSQERFAEAEALLERAAPELAAPTEAQLAQLDVLRAQAAAGLDRLPEAQVHILRALEHFEGVREEFARTADRMHWWGRTQGILEQALTITLRNGDAEATFDLIERSRSRAFLDELATRDIALPESAREWLDKKQRLTDRLAVLREIDGARGLGDRAASLAASLRVTAEEQPLDLFEEGAAGPRRLSLVKLSAQIEDAERLLSIVLERIQELGERQAREVVGEPATLEQVSELLAPADGRGALLIEFHALDDALLVFFAMRGDQLLDIAPVQVDLAELRAFARESFGGDGASAPESIDVARMNELLRPIVEPIFRVAQPGETLWIVPHDVLHALPLQAAEIDGVPLLERHPVCVSPSASVMQFCRAVPRERCNRSLVIGDPLGDLHSARDEAQRVARRLGSAPLLAAEATRARVLTELRASDGRVDVVHFACHARFDAQDALLSGLVLAGDENGGAESVLTAGDVLELHLRADLIVLSGCESGVSALRSGDELMGLTRAWLHAGAASVLVSHWSVDDLATALLMERFYELWLAPQVRRTKAVALREAAMWLRGLSAEQALELTEPEAPESSTRARVHRARALAWAGRGELAQRSLRRARVAVLDEQRELGSLEVWPSALELGPRERPFAHFSYWGSFTLVGDWT